MIIQSVFHFATTLIKMSTSLQVDRSQNDSLNLQVLQRQDPKIVEILDTASHVVMYNFEPLKQEWVCTTTRQTPL